MSRIFTPRTTFKPYEYPEVIQFRDAINAAIWFSSEWSFVSDISDFKTKLTDAEREMVVRTMLAISQIEVKVKKFWAKIGDTFPKPEIDQVGITFAESEIRHAVAYSDLLEKLNINDRFATIEQVPAIQKRIAYLEKSIKLPNKHQPLALTETLAFFSLFVENVSLFSQFLIMESVWKYRAALKDVDNAIQATRKEEQLHAMFGAWLVNQVLAENPNIDKTEFHEVIHGACVEAYEAELAIIDWIFEEGTVAYLPREALDIFLKRRFNESLAMINVPPVFEITPEQHMILNSHFQWFFDEMYAAINIDFFNKKSTAYTKNTHSFSPSDMNL